MPPSAQRRRTRKQPEPADRSDPEDVDEIQTPNRKRRRMNNNQAAAAAPDASTTPRAAAKKDRSSDIKVFEDDESFTTEDELNAVINHLREAKYHIAARLDLANEVQEAKNPEGKTAYAKIAGRGWTFYVDELQVRIGRPPDERQPGDINGDSTPNGNSDPSKIHIDLGPSKLVSRQHAEITFNNKYAKWEVFVSGRNGLRLDEHTLNRGQKHELHSGSVIEIAGTQMIFVTPNDTPEISPFIRDQARAAQEDDEDEDDVDLMRPPPQPHRTPDRGNGPRSGGQRGPSSATQQSNGTKQRGYHEGAQFSQHDASTDVPSSVARHRDSPAFPRGVMLETAEDIDYGADSAKDLKPPHSYAQLIGMAILSTAEEKLTLAKIYDWIKERYAFYRFSNGGWQNSIRHNLSLNKSFEKVARRTDEPGKGMKWQIVPEQRDDFIKKGLSGARKPSGRTSSVPNSPSKDPPSMDLHSSERVFARDTKDVPEPKKTPRASYGFKTSPGSTPPVSHYAQVKQAYTPEHGPAYGHGPFDGSSPTKGLGTGISPFPFSSKTRDRWTGLTETAVAGTPGGPRISFGSDAQEQHLVTPLITKQAPKLAPPSTARLPSHFMPFSSPAPFWKYADFTPKQLITSPVKADTKPNGHKEESGDEKNEEKKPIGKEESLIRSSSPPLPEGEVGQESPSRAASRRDHKFVAQPPVTFQPGRAPSVGAPSKTSGSYAASKSPVPPAAAQDEEDDEDDDEEGGVIDLARGFQPIGSFHRNISAGIVGPN